MCIVAKLSFYCIQEIVLFYSKLIISGTEIDELIYHATFIHTTVENFNIYTTQKCVKLKKRYLFYFVNKVKCLGIII